MKLVEVLGCVITATVMFSLILGAGGKKKDILDISFFTAMSVAVNTLIASAWWRTYEEAFTPWSIVIWTGIYSSCWLRSHTRSQEVKSKRRNVRLRQKP